MKKILLLLLLYTAFSFSQAPTKNVSGFYAGSGTMSASAIGQFDSTSKGVLIPRMTTTQRNAISSPATGLQVYNTTTNVLNVYNGTSWVEVGSGGGSTPSLDAVTDVGSNTPNHIIVGDLVASEYEDAFLQGVKIGHNGVTVKTESFVGAGAATIKTTYVSADRVLEMPDEDGFLATAVNVSTAQANAESYADGLIAGLDIPTATSQLTNNGSDGIHPFAEIRQIPENTSQLTNDSGFVTDISGKVDKNSSITGATKTKITYDSKGLVTAGTDATTADIADSTNKRYVTDAQLAKLNELTASMLPYKYTTPVNVTGTVSETQVLQVSIPANTFSANDMISVSLLFSKSGTAGNCTWKMKMSTSATMPSGTTGQIGTGAFNSSTLFAGYQRGALTIDSGNIYGFPFTTTTGNSDFVSSSSAISSQAFDRTVQNYLYLSLTNGSSADTTTLRGIKIANN